QRNGTSNTDIYAQRINTSGTVQWTADGVAISNAANNQTFPQLISDGSSGALITWWDQRNAATSTDVYAQKVNSSGVVQWTADGVAISTATNNQTNPQLASNGAGGAVLTWEDARNGAGNIDIYAQNVQSTGILPLKWLAFSGKLSAQDQASLQWKVEENGVVSYQVERNCGAGFSAVATITSKGDGMNSYSYIDAMPLVSNGCQYRIKQIDRDGRFTYSAILLLTSKQLKTTLTLNPNPVNAAATLQYKASTKGTITFRVLDAGGRTVLRKAVEVDAGVNAISLQLGSLSAGIYTLLFHSTEGQTTLNFVKE
ncbi:MAG TPA: T9SS type A sorting domain-containing protein, partial [Chitinophagaceae bacterium]|nr:T9SS type A sorting domain-containing protein [Chitinophagaceae bacterium]